MQIPDLSNEDQESKPISNEVPEASELKRKSKVANRGKATNPSDETDNEPTSKLEGKTTSRPTTRSRLQALATSWTNRPPDSTPDSPFQAEDQVEHSIPISDHEIPPHVGEDENPGRRLHAFEAAAKNASPAKLPWRYRLHLNRELTRRAYWDVAATFSLIVNVILISLLLIMAGQIRNLKTTVSSLLGGLYGNFAKMDQASINTTIMVNAQIPFNFNLPLSQNTEVVLTRDVSIPGAHVVINTGILNINAPANVTLPAGTNLPISVNLEVPVQTTIPISLQVPISIPMSQTGLHESFSGLQTTLLPLYCDFDKNAQYPEGTFICKDHDAATPVTP